MKTFWNNLPVRGKLLTSIGAIVAIFAVSLGIDFLFLAKQAATVTYTGTTIWSMLSAGTAARQDLVNADDLGGYALMATSPKEYADDKKAYEAAIAAVHKAADTLTALPLTEKERATLDAFTKWLGQYEAANERAFALKVKGNDAGARRAFLDFPTDQGQQLVATLAGSIRSSYAATNESMIAGSRSAESVTIAAGLIAIGVGIAIALLLGNSISRRLKQVTVSIDEVIREDVGALVGSMKKLAGGDLTAKVVAHSKPLTVVGNDEPATLAKAYNELLGGIQRAGEEFTNTTELLASMVTQIKASVEQVSTAAGEIAEGSTNLSQRTEEQASGLEETASSMEEFTATVKQNSQNAQEANSLGSSAQDQAKKSGEVMHDVVATMEKINASSQKIVEIISVIDGIAFQTNILALNAAVEAARAGEQGRGFAVVAGEVRSLAQRSAGAAKEIKELIGDTVAKVSDGATLVEQAGGTMDELVGSVERVTSILGDIAAASREQSIGIDQVNKAIAQMDEVTQQNAALVEEAAAAATSLEEQSRALLETVAAFKVDGQAKPAHPASAVRQAPAPHHAPARRPNITHKHVGTKPTATPGSNGKAVAVAAGGDDADWETF